MRNNKYDEPHMTIKNIIINNIDYSLVQNAPNYVSQGLLEVDFSFRKYDTCMHYMLHCIHVPSACQPRSIENRAWSTPNARSISFLTHSCRWANNSLFSLHH